MDTGSAPTQSKAPLYPIHSNQIISILAMAHLISESNATRTLDMYLAQNLVLRLDSVMDLFEQFRSPVVHLVLLKATFSTVGTWSNSVAFHSLIVPLCRGPVSRNRLRDLNQHHRYLISMCVKRYLGNQPCMCYLCHR